MAYDSMGDGALDYCPCRYGDSKLLFRGPQRDLNGAYVAMLGGSEVYGRYAELPLPAVLQGLIDRPVVNLGCINAGIDLILQDQTAKAICRKASVTVLQITGAQSLSNDFYTVHPRRNDRFLNAAPRLLELFGPVDLTDVHFTRHLLSQLCRRFPAEFDQMKAGLKRTWVHRMRILIKAVGGPVLLLWLADRRPEDPAEDWSQREPLFVDRAMLDQVAADACGLVEIVASREEIEAGLPRMIFSPLEALSARDMLGPVVQENAASALARALSPLL